MPQLQKLLGADPVQLAPKRRQARNDFSLATKYVLINTYEVVSGSDKKPRGLERKPARLERRPH